MNRLLSILGLLVVLTLFQVSARADAASLTKYYTKLLDEQVATAKAKPEAPSAWQQCEMTMQGAEADAAKMTEAERAPLLAKIKEYKPQIVAGAARNRASNLARSMQRLLDSAKSDIAEGNNKLVNLQEVYFNKLDGYFAEEDLKSLPAAELKALQAAYAEVKKGAK